MSKTKKGFTLIELIIEIAILGILAAILGKAKRLVKSMFIDMLPHTSGSKINFCHQRHQLKSCG